MSAGWGLFILGDNMKNLTHKRLREVLKYDPETGVFVWLKNMSSMVKKGNVAGSIYGDGYRIIKIDGNRYKASRLAWFYMEGYFPENQIDHINRIRNDDRWKNLRHVSHQCNSRNHNTLKNNTSGITGVCWHKKYQKWYADIKTTDKRVFLGLFDFKIDAAKARWKAEVKYGFPDCNTTSTALQYIRDRQNA